MNPVARIALVMAIVVGASIAAYRWWSGPERQIRRVLAGIAEGLSHEAPRTGLAAASAASDLRSYLSADVAIEPGRPFGTVNGRDAALAAAARTLMAAPSLRVEFVDVQMTVGDANQTADVTCTVMATVQDRAGQETVDAREMIITMVMEDGRWVVGRARAIEVLEPVTP